MVGDTVYDIAMARAAGAAAIGVTWGYHQARRWRAARAVIDAFATLVPTLDKNLDIVTHGQRPISPRFR